MSETPYNEDVQNETSISKIEGEEYEKIYLFCSAGMSTSMLASAMQQAADAHKLPFVVKAFPHGKLDEIIAKDRPDVILLGPQVKYMLEETQAKFGGEGIPIAVIDAGDYGMMNGERVLKSAIVELKKRRKNKLDRIEFADSILPYDRRRSKIKRRKKTEYLLCLSNKILESVHLLV